MRIPVFLSCPTRLSQIQEDCRKVVVRTLERYDLEPRSLGRTDYPTESPLREVRVLAGHCAGGVILGFEQFVSSGGISKRGTSEEQREMNPVTFPSPWNHLEAGILFSLGVPLLVFAEDGINGGIFDRGVSDVYIHKMPSRTMPRSNWGGLKAAIQKWQGTVRAHYYR